MPQAEIIRRPVGEVAPLAGLVHPVLRRIYAARGVRSPNDVEHGLAGLLPVSGLEDVEAAASLLLDHLQRGSSVVVVGDYDADGATSTALILRQLRRLGFDEVGFRVPDRMRHGYGLSRTLVEELAPARPHLIVTVDNGVSAHEGIAAARALGIDVLVTDHHLPGPSMPDYNVMINPNRHGSAFASRALAGVGVAFYLMAALSREWGQRTQAAAPPVTDLLDLVALGTIADLVPLDRNNRILVSEGLRRLRAGRTSPGLRALTAVAGRKLERLNERDLGFSLGPRLNAAGRIDDMTVGIRMLLTDDEAEAKALAARLDSLNRERRDIEGQMREEAAALMRKIRIEEGALPAGLCLFDTDWHAGVVGLLASRVKERVHRPVAAFAPATDGELRGSVRSVEGVHVRDVLEAIDTRCPGLILRFGGHAMAAGLSLAPGRLDQFSEAFAAEVDRWLSPEQMRGVFHSDGVLTPQELVLDTARVLEEGGPWGQGFPEPAFDGGFEVLAAKTVGETHLKLQVRQLEGGPPVEGICFGHYADPAALRVTRGDRLHLGYRLGVSDFGGWDRAELRVELLQPPSQA
ncbi:MAG: single-stranded-DNA-specific exonuclease RecJ [Steroidobacteraceae bacterium]|jgi:single-stranded-DNA-specific exonuclease